ncbi:hypothetical protein FEM48_Zijuj10G0003700 [Ziziphus jujuba var. spinosa]|uniref:Squalene cyclase N-terminal domain-containing protein n=1 Tax=Ziziphus jujuba var. spinosa TaxID=714518 RepID=A0A978UK66_ZIZJJ|nr:hypothetical protein FEM48_Zijuj10G0003700 [Ziziphus jujuba var. spinosa]
MWRLKVAYGGKDPNIFTTNEFVGRQIWEFDPDAGTDEERAQVEDARRHFTNNRHHVICLYVIGHLNSVLTREHRVEILRYIYNHQQEDGGWGFHKESPSCMFSTAMSYICMRLLGEGPEGGQDNACARARKWILDHGGVTYIPSWGKAWLAILGLIDYDGLNPMPPEFWMLPTYFPMHPGKMWCYCRTVYMPSSYLYGKRFVGPITPLVLQLREELHTQPYHQVNWSRARHLCIVYAVLLGRRSAWEALQNASSENTRLSVGC